MKHFTYANVTSTLALIMAVGGGGVAVAATVAKNSVGSPQIINNSVKAADLRQGSVTSSEVKNGSLGRADLSSQRLGIFHAYARVAGNNPLGLEATLTNYNSYNSGGGAVTATRTGVGPIHREVQELHHL